MKCSLCGHDAMGVPGPDGESRCVLCEKAFAAGQALERCAVLAEECAKRMAHYGYLDPDHGKLAGQIRAHGANTGGS